MDPRDEQWKRIQEQAGAASGPLPKDAKNITMYSNGFTVNDGPFRPFSDPLNQKFVNELATGACPAELKGEGDGPVHVALNDKRTEEYKEPPPPPYVMFSGEGNSLGGGGSASSATVQADAGCIQVDDDKPKTKIQIRFHDGSRKAQEFNQEHTVGNLRAFCMQCIGGQPVAIMGGFPPKEIAEDGATLKDAGLLNSAVTVKPR